MFLSPLTKVFKGSLILEPQNFHHRAVQEGRRSVRLQPAIHWREQCGSGNNSRFGIIEKLFEGGSVTTAVVRAREIWSGGKNELTVRCPSWIRGGDWCSVACFKSWVRLACTALFYFSL